jgi:glycosyltransferase involved in cell wall biosynthesis
MSALTYTSLFPSRVFPLKGVFVKHRAAAVAQLLGEKPRVVAPVPYFPNISGFGEWSRMGSHPGEEELDGIRIWHPRYFMTPKLGMAIYGPSMYWASRGLVRRLFKERSFQVLDAHFAYPDGLAAVLLGRMLGIPVVLTVRGNDINLSARFRTVRPLISFTLRHASAVVAVSESLADRAVSLGADPGNVRVVRNGVDTQLFRWMARAEARASLGLPQSETVLISVGHLIPRKGFDLVLRALGEGNEKTRGWRYAVIGDGPLRKDLDALAERMGISERVTFIGSLDQDRLALWYSASDLVVVPSRREGTPNVLMEALASGVPVVGSRVDGIPEVLRPEEDGLLFEAEDVSGLRMAIRSALKRRWDREAISRRNSVRGWEKAAEETVAVFERVRRMRCRSEERGTEPMQSPIA